METVKMSTAVQTKAGTASRTSQTVSSDQSQGFVKLLQEKKDIAQPDKAQTKTADKKPDSVLKKDDQAGQAAEPEKELKDKVPENGEESHGKDDAVEEALLQAGMWQTAAQLTGMLAEDAPSETAGTGEETLISSESAAPGVSLETTASSHLQVVQAALAATEESPRIQMGDGETMTQTAAAEPAVYQAVGEVLAENPTERTAEQPAESGAPDTERAEKAGKPAENEKPADTGQPAAARETDRSQRNAAEVVRQDETPDRNASPEQEKNGAWQSASRETEADENRTASNVQTGVSETRQSRRTEQEPTREPVYRTDSVREPSWQSFAGQKTEEIPLRTSQTHLPQDLGKTLAARLPGTGQELVIELEPAALGKLTIKLAYEGGRAAVSILASNPRTLEVLSQRASEIAAILEEKTGQDTIIYTHAPEQQNQGEQEQQSQGGGRQEQRQEQQKQHEDQHQTESFAQQLRLGLI